VWIRAQDDVLIRADSIVIIENTQTGLRAECITGRVIQLTNSVCDSAFQLELLEEIRRAGADERRATVVMPANENNSPSWRREYVDTLVDHL